MSNNMKINPISKTSKDTILRKTAYALPDRPSANGMKSEDIKRAFYMAITDEEDSIIAELERVINECNEIIETIIGRSFTHVDNTNNPHNVTKAQIGLGKVDNTSDANKPISVLQQYELNKKINKTDIQDNVESIDADKPLSAYRGKLLNEKIDEFYNILSKTIDDALANAKQYSDDLVNNVIDGAPDALNTLKEVADWINSDESGSVAIAQKVENLENNKVDKVEGKQLSTNDYTTEEKTKLNNMPTDAEKNVQSDWGETDSTKDEFIKNKPTIPSKLSDLTEDAEHNLVSDSQIETWNNKQEKINLDDNPTENSANPVKSAGVYKALENKVDKADGKSLSTNDYTNDDKFKVQNLGTSSSRNVGTAAGEIPMLNTNGKLDESILPAVALMDTFEASSEAEMTALSAQKGDICIRSDINKTFILKTAPASVVSNWVVLKTPTDLVLGVNGKTGNVSLSSQDLTDGDDIVHKQEGKDLSTNDYTNVEKNKLANIENNAQKNVQSDWNSTDTNSDEYIKNKPTIPNKLSQLGEDSTHRFVTDEEKSTWNNKSNFDGSYNNLTNKPVVNTSNTKTLGTQEAEEFSATNPLQLHKIAKTGKYTDLIDAPGFELSGTTLTINL